MLACFAVWATLHSEFMCFNKKQVGICQGLAARQGRARRRAEAEFDNVVPWKLWEETTLRRSAEHRTSEEYSGAGRRRWQTLTSVP